MPIKDDQVHTIRESKRQSWWVYSRARRTYGGPQGYFTCGKPGHEWDTCLERSCGNCGRKGHDTGTCRRRVTSEGIPERSVTIEVIVEGKPITTILDTGAKPSVMDTYRTP